MIIQNAVSCLNCGDFIFSSHRNDFVTCTCGSISVDGGQSYLRRVGAIDACVDMSWSLPDDVYHDCADAVDKAKETNRNKFGIANAVMRVLREKNRIVAEGESRVLATYKDEIMVEEADGSINRYRKVVDES